MRNSALAVLVLGVAPAACRRPAPPRKPPARCDWESWHAGNEVTNTDSLQRGARNFINYCAGCHSLKYLRYSRMAKDLKIPTEQLKTYLLPAGAIARRLHAGEPRCPPMRSPGSARNRPTCR